MIYFKLTSQEVARVQRAAKFAGFPWEPICSRPKTARQFCRRVEAEMRQRGVVLANSRKPRLSKLISDSKGLSRFAGQFGRLLQDFEITGLQRGAS